VLRILQIIDGKELLNERTNTENRYLKKVGIGHWTARNVHSALSCSVLTRLISLVSGRNQTHGG
jgi:hypothetical protein